MNDELEKRLREINNEDMILVVFIILIFITYIANQAEKNYFIKRLEEDKKKYYYLQIFVFLVVVIINFYYVGLSYNEVESLKYEEYSKKKEYANLSLIASLAALVAGLIILYISISDTEIDAEITL